MIHQECIQNKGSLAKIEVHFPNCSEANIVQDINSIALFEEFVRQ